MTPLSHHISKEDIEKLLQDSAGAMERGFMPVLVVLANKDDIGHVMLVSMEQIDIDKLLQAILEGRECAPS